MADRISSILEFKPVGNFLWIVNKNTTFSLDQMVQDGDNNNFKFVPVQSCNDNWRSNINSDFTLNRNAITLCQYINGGTSVDVEPPAVSLIATEVGYGGVIVTLDNSSSQSTVIQLGSTPQELKGIFLINDDTDVVLAYCILPETITVNNYLQLSYTSPIIEITSTVSTPTG